MKNLSSRFAEGLSELESAAIVQNIKDRFKRYENPPEITGVLDYEHNVLITNNGLDYQSLDSMDPQLLAILNTKASQAVGYGVRRLPLTDSMARDLLDDDVMDKSEIEQSIETLEPNNDSNKSLSQENLKRAFANQMVLLVQLDEYVKDNKLDNSLDQHKDDILHRVGQEAFNHQYTDAIDTLASDANELIGGLSR